MEWKDLREKGTHWKISPSIQSAIIIIIALIQQELQSLGLCRWLVVWWLAECFEGSQDQKEYDNPPPFDCLQRKKLLEMDGSCCCFWL